MNFLERNEIFISEEFTSRCRIALCDWVNYWVNAGVESIESEELRDDTRLFCSFALSNLETYVRKITALVISQESIKNLQEVTDNDIRTAVTSIMSTGIKFLL